MSDKPKLTLESAQREFWEECKTVLIAEGWDWDDEAGAPEYDCNGVILDEAQLAWAALQWLFARNMMNGIRWIPWVRIGPGHRDALRWLLKQVGERLKREKEEADAGQTEIDA